MIENKSTTCEIFDKIENKYPSNKIPIYKNINLIEKNKKYINEQTFDSNSC